MKKLIYIMFMLVIIAVGCYVGYICIDNTDKNSKTEEVNSNSIEDANIDLENNFTDNETRLDELKNKENTSNTNTENNTDTNNDENKSVSNNNEVDSEAKAIDIVKQNWGEDNTVYFTSDGKNKNGDYVIVVREKSSTKALYFYSVYSDGTFTIQ